MVFIALFLATLKAKHEIGPINHYIRPILRLFDAMFSKLLKFIQNRPKLMTAELIINQNHRKFISLGIPQSEKLTKNTQS